MNIKPIIVMTLILVYPLISGCEKIRIFIEANNYGFDLADSTQQDTTETDVSATRHPDGRQAELLSVFFGLDNGLPRIANKGICKGASGKDGMPAVFSHEIDVDTMQAGDFRVVRASGAIGEITCVTLAPADDAGEHRTVLIVGQYGSADDQPVNVEIIGNLLSIDGQVNFRGARSPVIALEEGPTMEWSEVVPEDEWGLGRPATLLPWGGGSGCPLGTRQVVRVTWAGGVTKPGGQEIDDNERAAYRVRMTVSGGSQIELVPFAIGDLGDGDNNHELCLDQAGTPLHVEFPAGLVTDPREDLNPATRIEVTVTDSGRLLI
jgi:hypothetical protein